MAWNGTVTCSSCCQSGHNRSTCPRRKERYKEALAVPEEDRGYSERRLIEEFEYKKQRNSSRKCSYCGEQGHNRRSCPKLKEHVGYVAKQEKAFRAAFVEHLNETGLNIGALVAASSNDNTQGLHIVTSINWDDISITTSHQALRRFIIAKPVHLLCESRRSRNHFNIAAPDHWSVGPAWSEKENRWQEKHHAVEVVSPSATAATPNEDWTESNKEIKEFFKDRESWQWPKEDDSSLYYSCDWWDLEEKTS